MFSRIFLLLSVTLLNACGAPVNLRLIDHNQCLEFGFIAWSPDYAYCRLSLQQQRRGEVVTVLLPPRKEGHSTIIPSLAAPEVSSPTPNEPPAAIPAPRSPVTNTPTSKQLKAPFEFLSRPL